MPWRVHVRLPLGPRLMAQYKNTPLYALDPQTGGLHPIFQAGDTIIPGTLYLGHAELWASKDIPRRVPTADSLKMTRKRSSSVPPGMKLSPLGISEQKPGHFESQEEGQSKSKSGIRNIYPKGRRHTRKSRTSKRPEVPKQMPTILESPPKRWTLGTAVNNAGPREPFSTGQLRFDASGQNEKPFGMDDEMPELVSPDDDEEDWGYEPIISVMETVTDISKEATRTPADFTGISPIETLLLEGQVRNVVEGIRKWEKARADERCYKRRYTMKYK